MDSGSCVMNHFIHCKDTHFPPDVQIPVQKNRIFSEKKPLPASRCSASLRCLERSDVYLLWKDKKSESNLSGLIVYRRFCAGNQRVQGLAFGRWWLVESF